MDDRKVHSRSVGGRRRWFFARCPCREDTCRRRAGVAAAAGLVLMLSYAAVVTGVILLPKSLEGLVFGECSKQLWTAFEGDLGPRTVSVWSHGGGERYTGFVSAILRDALPGYKVVWGRARGEVTVAVVSGDVLAEDMPPPQGVPYIVIDPDFNPVKTCVLPNNGNHRLATLQPAAPLQVDEFHLPRFAVRAPVPPPTLRLLAEDDISTRRYALGYVNNHCTPQRERLFALMRDRLGADQVVVRGACSSPSHTPPGPNTAVDMSDCKAVMALERQQLRGYITDGIVDAFMAGAVPVFWGDSGFAAQVFNPDAYFDVGNYDTLEAGADALAELLRDGSTLRHMRQQPALQATGYRYFDWTRDTAAFHYIVEYLRKMLLPPGAARGHRRRLRGT